MSTQLVEIPEDDETMAIHGLVYVVVAIMATVVITILMFLSGPIS